MLAAVLNQHCPVVKICCLAKGITMIVKCKSAVMTFLRTFPVQLRSDWLTLFSSIGYRSRLDERPLRYVTGPHTLKEMQHINQKVNADLEQKSTLFDLLMFRDVLGCFYLPSGESVGIPGLSQEGCQIDGVFPGDTSVNIDNRSGWLAGYVVLE